MIIVTGAFGFIGSCLVAELSRMGLGRKIIVVDDFYKTKKEANLDGLTIRDWIHRDLFIDWLESKINHVDYVVHLGARTDTAEKSVQVFDKLNIEYSKRIWEICARDQVPFIYASSASVYGDGSKGFKDDHDLTSQLVAINPYGDSKLAFDQWILDQEMQPPYWVGLRFFNVYGPNEYHKNAMASVVYHAYNQISASKEMKLFRSHKPEYKDGEQSRDFIYVKDVVKVLNHLIHHRIENGIYNVGTGETRTFKDLAASAFKTMNMKEKISYIDTPQAIRASYQYYTKAEMDKLKSQISGLEFISIEEGIEDYIKNYLVPRKYFR
jgi:ADP-L-glycero-D-manno-heptose 6-epimerase